MNIFWGVFCFVFSFTSLCAWDATLEWDPNPDTDQIMHYTVYTGPSAGPWTEIGKSFPMMPMPMSSEGPPPMTFTLTNQTGKPCFAVTATNAFGESDRSNQVCGQDKGGIPKNLRFRR